MGLQTKNNLRFIYIALIIVAILGFLLSAVVIDIKMLNISEGFGARNIFSLLGKTASSPSGMSSSQGKLLELIDGNDMFAEVKVKFSISVTAYFLVILTLLINLVLVLLKKWKKVVTVISFVSFTLFSYAGYSMMSLSKVLYNALEESLGFLATLVNISEMVKFSLGTGYWLTFTALATIFFIEVVVLIAGKIKIRGKINHG